MRRIASLMMTVLMSAAPLCGQSMPHKAKRMPHSIQNISFPSSVLGSGTTTASGLKYWDVTAGSGDVATRGKVVKIRYTGWLEHGQEFYSSAAEGQPSIFRLGAGNVIKGWDEGIEGMKVGGKRQLHIPAELAFGTAGSPPLIPPNAQLVYDIQLIGVQ